MKFKLSVFVAVVGPLVVEAVQWRLPNGATIEALQKSDVQKSTWVAFVDALVPSPERTLCECKFGTGLCIKSVTPKAGSEVQIVLLHDKSPIDNLCEITAPLESAEVEQATTEIDGKTVALPDFLSFLANKFNSTMVDFQTDSMGDDDDPMGPRGVPGGESDGNVEKAAKDGGDLSHDLNEADDSTSEFPHSLEPSQVQVQKTDTDQISSARPFNSSISHDLKVDEKRNKLKKFKDVAQNQGGTNSTNSNPEGNTANTPKSNQQMKQPNSKSSITGFKLKKEFFEFRLMFHRILEQLTLYFELERAQKELEERINATHCKYQALFDQIKNNTKPEMFAYQIAALLQVQEAIVDSQLTADIFVGPQLPIQGKFKISKAIKFDELFNACQNDWENGFLFAGDSKLFMKVCYANRNEGLTLAAYSRLMQEMLEQHYFVLFDRKLVRCYRQCLKDPLPIFVHQFGFARGKSAEFIQMLLNNEELIVEFLQSSNSKQKQSLNSKQQQSQSFDEHITYQSNKIANRNSRLFIGCFCLAAAVALFLTPFLVQASGSWTEGILF